MLKFCAAGDSDFDSENDSEYGYLGNNSFDCEEKENLGQTEVASVTKAEKCVNNCLVKSEEENDKEFSVILLTDLQNAVIIGNTDIVESSIESNPLVCDATLGSGWTPLIYAANFGNLSVVKLLLKYGADVNKADSQNCTPIIAACKCHKKSPEVLEIITILINAGSNVLKCDSTGKTPLMYAARSGNCAHIDSILSSNKETINQSDKNGWTALDWAISKSFSSTVKLLIDHGANVYKKTNQPTSKIIEELLKPIASSNININNNFMTKCVASSDSTSNSNSLSEDTEIMEDSLSLRPSEPISISMKSNIINEEKEHQIYGQLELLLCGLNLSHLIHLFHEHDVHFQQLLYFTTDDLVKIGVKQLGAQKRILTAVKDWHTTKWSEESIPNFTSTALSFENLQGILKSSTEHVLYISSALRYVRNQLEKYPKVLVPPADILSKSDPHSMVVSQVEELVLTTHTFCQSLKALHVMSINMKEGPLPFKQVDLIEKKKFKKSSKFGKYALYITLPCAIAVAIFLKRGLSFHKLVPSFR